MASDFKRRSSSSVSRRSVSSQRGGSRTYRQVPSQNNMYVSTRVGDMDRAERQAAAKASQRRWMVRIALFGIAFLLVIAGVVALFVSPVFTINSVSVKGAEHLTKQEMLALAEVPSDTTLLRVDAAQIEQNCLRDAWIESVAINRVFPDTLELEVKERQIAATVAVPTGSSNITRLWAISSDRIWLMPIPDKESEAAATVSQKIYEDAESVLRIVDVPYGTSPDIGKECTDGNVNNALSIVSGMTTQLADMVVRVSATDAESTILTLSNGVEVAFGTPENIREKERVVLALLDEYEGSIAYINVRTVANPTWRSL